MIAFSYSGRSLLDKCPYSYWLKYVHRFKLPLVDSTGVVPGKVVHKLAELFFKANCDWRVFDDKLPEVFNHYINKPYVTLNASAFASNRDEAWRVICRYKDNFVREIQKQGLVKPWYSSEGRFGFYDNPFMFTPDIGLTGGWDLLTGETKNSPLILVDFKASDSLYYLDKRQLFFYAVGVEKFLGVTVGTVAFLLFKKRRTVVYGISDEQRVQTIKWIKDGVARIKRGEFNPTPSKYSCSLCPFRELCKYVYTGKPRAGKEGSVMLLPQGAL